MPADRGDHGAGVFFVSSVCCGGVGWVRERGEESAVALTVGHCSQQDSKNVHICRIHYEKNRIRIPRWFLRRNSILLEIKLLVC